MYIYNTSFSLRVNDAGQRSLTYRILINKILIHVLQDLR